MVRRLFEFCLSVLLVSLCVPARANLANFNALTAGTSYAPPAIFSNGGLDFDVLFGLGNLNVAAVSGSVNPSFTGNYLRLNSNTALNVNLPTGASQIQFDFIRNNPATALVINGSWFDVAQIPGTVSGVSVSQQLPTSSNWGSILATGTINSFVVVGTEFYLDNLNATLSPGLSGDFNRNHVVDAADFVLLRKTLYSRTGYNSWRANFGATDAGLGASTVPEPATIWLTVGALVALPRRRGRAA